MVYQALLDFSLSRDVGRVLQVLEQTLPLVESTSTIQIRNFVNDFLRDSRKDSSPEPLYLRIFKNLDHKDQRTISWKIAKILGSILTWERNHHLEGYEEMETKIKRIRDILKLPPNRIDGLAPDMMKAVFLPLLGDEVLLLKAAFPESIDFCWPPIEKKIKECFDDKVMLDPSVTFQQLKKYLESHGTQLKELTFGEGQFINTPHLSFMQLSELIRLCPNLQKLVLHKLGSLMLINLDFLTPLRHLKILEISDCHIGSLQIESAHFENHLNLERLILPHNAIDTKGLNILSKVPFTNLWELNVMDNNLEYPGLTHLLRSLKKLKIFIYSDDSVSEAGKIEIDDLCISSGIRTKSE